MSRACATCDKRFLDLALKTHMARDHAKRSSHSLWISQSLLSPTTECGPRQIQTMWSSMGVNSPPTYRRTICRQLHNIWHSEHTSRPISLKPNGFMGGPKRQDTANAFHRYTMYYMYIWLIEKKSPLAFSQYSASEHCEQCNVAIDWGCKIGQR